MTIFVNLESECVVARRVEQVYELPPMPDLGRRILELQSNPNADARQLAKVVQLDPSLAAQVIRFASSSYYGYRGRVTNIQDAITRVLGFDMVMHLALGLAAGRSFRIPDEGPLGLTSFWKHAVGSAVLVQKLGMVMPETMRPPPGLCYLSGLLHDFGILLLGHLFPPEFQLLNKLAQANPGRSVADLEHSLLGMGQARDVLAMGHARIGAWLMEVWNMPDPVRVALLEHHNPDYHGEHDLLVHLVQLGDFLLQYDTERPELEDIPSVNLGKLQLLPELVLDVFDQTMAARAELVALSGHLTAAS